MTDPLSVNPGANPALLNDPGLLLTSAQAAQLLKMSVAFLAHDRWAGKRHGQGPLIPFIKVGGRAVRYRRADIDNHIAKCRVAWPLRCADGC